MYSSFNSSTYIFLFKIFLSKFFFLSSSERSILLLGYESFELSIDVLFELSPHFLFYLIVTFFLLLFSSNVNVSSSFASFEDIDNYFSFSYLSL